MIDIFSVIEDLRFRTSLLESLEWDEDLLQTFLFYFDDQLRKNADFNKLLTDIENHFGSETLKLLPSFLKKKLWN